MILFDKVQVPHYNYVGDSILGYKAHMGAGSITSNVKSDKKLVVVRDGTAEVATGRKKVGAWWATTWRWLRLSPQSPAVLDGAAALPPLLGAGHRACRMHL